MLIPFFILLALTLVASQYHTDHHHFEHESSSPIFMKKNNVPNYNERKNPVYYDFSYSVQDDHTKDIKNQIELRKDDMVKGHYDMIDSDGYKRIVDYIADDKNGFQAMVHREKTDIHVPTPTVAYHQNQYYHNAYPEHSLDYHHMDLAVGTGKPRKLNEHVSYAKHYLKDEPMSISVHAEESKRPNHHQVFAEHSLKHHHIQMPVYYAEPHKSAILYSDAIKPVDANKMDQKSIKNHTSQKQYIASNYFIPVEQKARIPVKTPVLYNLAKPTLSHHHAKTHVSFHGINAKYEY